ncbi:MAG: hypothetical protein E6Q97_38775 [Desulfurellales bacterium]|nr:MAG: hypothetical protein E6Q97_38775 [Desulfurellales bacterium]
MKTHDDLQAAIEAERHGTGALTIQEAVEMNELEIALAQRGHLGSLNTARLAWLRERFSKHGRLYAP